MNVLANVTKIQGNSETLSFTIAKISRINKNIVRKAAPPKQFSDKYEVSNPH